tara:strand:- start:4720 stop:6537 length:1818 start_codon:yes stop_codon:yes gene_type:complete
MEVLLSLLNGENVILSGPTSFGKSLILDAYIAKSNLNSVAAILPTLALIDEVRRRVSKNFPYVQVVTTTGEEFDRSRPVFFALTQERFLQRRDIDRLDLLFVDEFYKLDEGRDDSRFEVLNLALYRGIPKSKQVFMAGPHIQGISLGERWRGRFNFIATDYRTVAVNIFDRSDAKNREKTFISDLRGVGEESSLVFAATPGSAQKIAHLIRDAGIEYGSEESRLTAQWLRENYHPEWDVADAVEAGIGLHHGRIPRSIGQLFVRLFDSGVLKVLICTSTLIEGVNTSAANVFVYDKKINTTDFDFFSFANIRGRVGRMMRHFVGNAYLYHVAPEEIEVDIDIPILAQESPSSEYLLINLEDGDLDVEGLGAKQNAINRSDLPLEVLREYSYLGLDLLEEFSDFIKSEMKKGVPFVWSGIPDYEEMNAVASVGLFIAHKRRQATGVHSPKQVSWAWTQLMQNKALGVFISWFVDKFEEEGANDGIDRCFQFLQAAEFAFPRAISVGEAIVNLHSSSKKANYSLFVHGLEKWFRPSWMKTLDEMGIPVPFSERYKDDVPPHASKLDAMNKLAVLNSQDRFKGIDGRLYDLAFDYGNVPLLDGPENRA